MTQRKILVVDDEAAIRFGIRDFLETQGFEVSEADSCQQAKEQFASAEPDIALIDYQLGDGNAVDLIPQLREINAEIPILILTAHGSIDLAVQAVKEGAEHFLTKPIELPTLLTILQRLLENRRIRRKHLANTARESRASIDPFLGESPAIRELACQARKVLQADCPILIQGETGTGKSLLASWLHANGPRSEEAFVDLNCAGLMRDFLETELFGHEKGAFTGAGAAKAGLLETAHRGTVFLDEIGDVDPQIQPKLLKVLEEKRFRRLGEVRDRKVDICLIAATHQNLAALVRENRFRSDLYFRINTITLRVPPLRERVVDIALLAESMISRISLETGRRRAIALSAQAMSAMQQYAWPGNIREMRNVLDRAALLCEDGKIELRDLKFDDLGASNAPGERAELTLREVEKRHIEQVLREESGRVEAAAQRLGIPRSSLYQKLKVYGLTSSRI